jgi:hypothetical protein
MLTTTAITIQIVATAGSGLTLFIPSSCFYHFAAPPFLPRLQFPKRYTYFFPPRRS